MGPRGQRVSPWEWSFWYPRESTPPPQYQGRTALCLWGCTGGGGVKLENLWNKKKSPNQLCWLITHKGQQNKQSPGQSLLQHRIPKKLYLLCHVCFWPPCHYFTPTVDSGVFCMQTLLKEMKLKQNQMYLKNPWVYKRNMFLWSCQTYTH
mgnify:CR=1 FL=1